jgi:hypothetical protein
VELVIGFTQARCKCGAQRQAGRTCARCGGEPDETDSELDRRRAIVGAVAERPLVGAVAPLKLDDSFAILGAWPDRFFASYGTTNEDTVEEAAGRLREVLSELDVLHKRAASGRRLRPNHGQWFAIDGVLAAFTDLRDAYLDALIAETVEKARDAGARGQAAIDAAAAALDHFNRYSDAWLTVDAGDLSHEFGDLLAGAQAVASLSETSNMIELDRAGAQLFERITEGKVACPTGLGVGLQLLNLAVEGSLDPNRFWTATGKVYRVLAENKSALVSLFADAAWRDDFVAVTRETRDAGFEAAAVAEAAGGNRRRLIQSALRLAARQIERAAQPLLATILAVHLHRPYASERRRDINSLLMRAGQAGLSDLLDGLDPKLRDADAHAAFTIESEGVRLTGTRGELEYLSDDELVDVTLAGTESVIAQYWGLLAALVDAGIDAEEIEQAIAAEIDAEDTIKFTLLLNGWHEIDVKLEDTWLCASGRRNGPSMLGLIPAVVAAAPPGCEIVTLIATEGAEKHTARGPAGPVRGWSHCDDELDKEIAFTSLGMVWTIDGEPLLSRAHVGKSTPTVRSKL